MLLRRFTQHKLQLVTIAAALAATAAIFAAVALASSTYEYCSGCTINANSTRTSNATRFAILSYVHRLSGPGSGVEIGTFARPPGGGYWCATTSFGTEVSCDPGGHEVYGEADNYGAGNYGFNAHLTY